MNFPFLSENFLHNSGKKGLGNNDVLFGATTNLVSSWVRFPVPVFLPRSGKIQQRERKGMASDKRSAFVKMCCV